jgi:pentatricopeptide repeat protein
MLRFLRFEKCIAIWRLKFRPRRRHSSHLSIAYDDYDARSCQQATRQPSTTSQIRTHEQDRASRLEHERMLKLTNQFLSRNEWNSSEIKVWRDIFHYWISARATHMLKQNESKLGCKSPEFALLLFNTFISKGNPSDIQEIVSSEDHPMGGLVNLIEQLLLPFHDSSTHKKVQSDELFEELLHALFQASRVIECMKKFQIDPSYPRLKEDKWTLNWVELYIWSRRVDLLQKFLRFQRQGIKFETACGGESSADGCLKRMTRIFNALIVEDKAPLERVYNTLMSTWVHSGLPQSLDEAMDLLKMMERDDRIEISLPIPYNLVMQACNKFNRADIAKAVWGEIQEGKSLARPDVTTLATFLQVLVNCDQLDYAISILNEIEDGEGNFSGKTNNVCYNIILRGLAKSYRVNARVQAQNYLQKMIHLSATKENPWVAPDRISYSMVMDIISRDGGTSVEEILLNCHLFANKFNGLKPDCMMYNIALGTILNEIGNADAHNVPDPASIAQRSLSLLRTMSSHADFSPNTISYNTVFHILSTIKVPWEVIESLFEEMKLKYISGDDSVKPDEITYNIILRAKFTKPTNRSIESALKLFDEMKEFEMTPGCDSFNCLMRVIIQNEMPGALGLAREILEHMEAEHVIGGVSPDSNSYNILLHGYAKEGTLWAVREAEFLLERMLILARDPNRWQCRPNIVTYSCMMDAYSKARIPNAGSKADTLLCSMKKEGIKPNTICYNAAINCWANDEHDDKLLHAERLLFEMIDDAKINFMVKPNAITYTTIMKCWAKSKREEAPERIETILREMELCFKRGDASMSPTAYSYSTVISAWGRIGRSDKALDILRKMEEHYDTKKSKVRPNVSCYNVAINAIGKSKRSTKAQEAASLLQHMKNRHTQSGWKDVEPTAISYSSVLNACAYSNHEDKAETLRIAQNTFDDMLQSVTPTHSCYVNYLTACANLLPPGAHRDALIVAAFRDCRSRIGNVNEFLINCLRKFTSRSVYQQEMNSLRSS